MSSREPDFDRASQEHLYEISVIYRWWKPICALAWAFFIIFEVGMGLDRYYSSSPLCPYSDNAYGEWYFYSCYAVLGGFTFTWIVLLLKLLLKRDGGAKEAPLYVAFNIVTMATVATYIAVVFQTGICIDVLGGVYPAAIWGEWLACGPLLVFTTLTVVDKPNLSMTDYGFIAGLFFCLLFAFFAIPPQPVEAGVWWLVASCVAYAPTIVMPWYTEKDKLAVLAAVSEQEKHLYMDKYAKRTNLAWWLTVMFAVYTANYFVNIFNGYSDAVTIVMYQILSLLTKGAFAAITMDIHIDLLFEAERALLEEQRANESRRGFMKYIFHEVRTPLNSLTMGIDLLSSSANLDDQDRDYLLMMRSSSEFMSDTLDDVLNMQKIEEGKFELEFEPFSFRLTVFRIMNTFRGAVIRKNILLSSNISPDTPEELLGDMHRIEHVMGNFLSNAIKFTPENKRVNIAVTCERREIRQDGKEMAIIKVAVNDEGVGISTENQALLFNNFVQIRPSELQKGKGSGLGLALVKNVVQMHGGTIGVTSKEGEGSSFFFIVPFEVVAVAPGSVTAGFGSEEGLAVDKIEIKIQPPAERSVTTLSQKSDVSDMSMSPLHSESGLVFLVVDDAESNTKMITMLLKRLGVKSDSADNGEAAWKMVRADLHAYDLVLMDNLMPIMTGAESATAMRQSGYLNIIVGLTGNVMDDDIKQYVDAGANLVLAKPLKKTTLEKIIAFVKKHGSVAKPGMKLVDQGEIYVWVPK